MFGAVYLHTCLFPLHTAGSDYTQVSQELVFVPVSAGTRQCVDIPILQDELAEGSEVFQVNLGTQNIFYRSFIGPIRTATVTVADAPTEPTSDTDATEPTSDTDATEPTSDTDATEPPTIPTATSTPTPTPDDGGGATDDPTTGGDRDTDDTTDPPTGGDGSNPNTPNTDSDPNDDGEGPGSNSNPSPDGSVSEDNDTPPTVGVADYGVIAKSLSPVLLLLAASLGLLL